RTLLLLLLAAVGLVMLVVCANVANLFLAQATARGKEMSIRLALGAGRWRIVRQLLAESLTLSLLGGALGLVVAAWGSRLLVSIAPVSLPSVREIGIDGNVLAFALVLSLAVSVLFAIIPALTVSQTNPSEALRESGTRTTAGPRRHRVRGAFVVAEIAAAFVLLTGAGLLVRSFISVMDADPGFQAEHALLMELTLPKVNYATREQSMSFFQEALSEIQSIPGVEAAGAATDIPLRGNWRKLISTEGAAESQSDGMSTMMYTVVYQDYMQALGIRLKRGRYFNEHDRSGSERVVIVNEALARKYWPNEDPIGKRLKTGTADSPVPWLRVVGVVGDVRNNGMDADTRPHAYEPLLQMSFAQRGLAVAVRGKGDPAELTSAVLSRISKVDPEMAVAGVRTMDSGVEESVAP
ncbi:MAG: FtsX-like permease family protein, partial [bacterium]|nr:FtsX-like permease family protein [bacterium]